MRLSRADFDELCDGHCSADGELDAATFEEVTADCQFVSLNKF